MPLSNFISTLLNNIFLLLALAAVNDTVAMESRLSPKYKNMILGISIGIITIAVMANPFSFTPGLVFDTRSVIISLTALYFGFIPGIISSLMAGLYRIYIGGHGALPGVFVISCSLLTGLLWKYLRPRFLEESEETPGVLELYLLGVLVHIQMIALMNLLPQELASRVIASIKWPVMILFPLATVVLGKILSRQKKRMDSLDTVTLQERKFRKIIEKGWDIITLISRQGKIQEIIGSSEILSAFTGESTSLLPGTLFSDLIPSQRHELFTLSFHYCLENPGQGRTLQIPFPVRQESGDFSSQNCLWAEISLFNYLNDPDVEAILVVIRDITGQKSDQQSSEALASRLALACRSAEMGIWDLDLISNKLLWDDQMYHIYDLDPSAFKSHFEEWTTHVHPDDLAPAWSGIKMAMDRHQDFTIQFRIITGKGQIKHIEAHGTVQRNQENEPIRLIGVNRDISKRTRAEQLLMKREAELSKAQSMARLGTWEFLLDQGKVLASTEARAIYGMSDEEYTIQQVSEIPLPEYREPLDRAMKALIREGAPYSIEFQIRRPSDGSIAWICSRADFDPANNLVSGIIQDITETRRATEDREKLLLQLRQSQKMEAIGRLAGGIAHDFNNMLNVIMGFSDLALARVASTDPLYRDLEEVQKAASRSAKLTKRLLAFSRQQIIAPKPMNLNDHIEKSIKMLNAMVGENIQIEMNLFPNPWNVQMDSSQVDQILTNLSVNARDAILSSLDESGEIRQNGLISLSTLNARITPEALEQMDRVFSSTQENEDASQRKSIPLGDYVGLIFRDNGSGMNTETQDHIFEPFFSTKPEGEGTGLGLATVYGIITQNRGFISLSSSPEKGTCFTIYLPRCTEEASAPKETMDQGNETSSNGAHEVQKTGDTTILIVEDEEQLLNLAQRILNKKGYRTLAAMTPEDALKLASQERNTIDLLLTDVIMPGMNGKELRHAVERIIPGVSTLFMSGYTAEIITEKGFLEKGVDFLPKPFSPRELAGKVEEALKKRQGPPEADLAN